MRLLLAVIGTLAFLFPVDVLAARQCGKAGQRACAWYEQIPICNANLLESKGKCYHPDCGRHGDTACVPSQRLQPCDWGLVINLSGKCLRPKEVIDDSALARKAETEYCKSVVSTLSSGKAPPALAPVIAPLQKAAADAKRAAASIGDKAKEFARRNATVYREFARISETAKKNAATAAKLRRLLAPDEFCAHRTYQERVNQFKDLGLWPEQQLKLATSDGEPRLFTVAAAETPHWLFAVGAEIDLNLVVDGKAALMFLWDISAMKVGPVALLSIGGKTNVGAKGNWPILKLLHQPESEIGKGTDVYAEVGLDFEIAPCVALGGFIQANFSNASFTGIGAGIGSGAACIPADVGGGAEWHWVLLPSSGLGGAALDGAL